PFAQASRFGRGESLQVKVTSPAYDSERYGAVPYLAAAAVLDREGRNLTLFTVNRDREGALLVDADMRAWPGCRVLEHLTLCAGDPLAANDAEQPERVRPRSVAGARMEGGRLSAVRPPLSWKVVRLALPESWPRAPGARRALARAPGG